MTNKLLMTALLLFGLLYSCGGEGHVDTAIEVAMTYDSLNKEVNFRILNDGKSFYASTEYMGVSLIGDSLIFEPFPLFKNMDYYSFEYTEMIKVDSGDTVFQKIKRIEVFNPENWNYYIRVYKAPFEKYIEERKIDVVNLKDFKEFEKESSFLIEVNTLSIK